MTAHSAEPLRVLMVPSTYPTPQRPGAGAFVRAFAAALDRAGASVQVIAPHPLGRGPAPTDPGDPVPTLRPRYPSFSARRLGPVRTFAWTVRAFCRATVRALPRLESAPEVVYGHFLYPGGAAALAASEALGVPAVAALGEGRPQRHEEELGAQRVAATARGLAGLLCVNAWNRDYCVERLSVDPRRTLVRANAADTAFFYPRDRTEARARLGLPADRLLVAFTGHFDENKGPLRLLAALERVPGMAGLFLGKGPAHPSGDRVAFAGEVPHDQVPAYLSAGDLFSLPVRTEASSNSLAEALACGLPAVVSDLPGLRAMADASCARFVDPDDPQALAEALRALAQDPGLRQRMGRAALARARAYDLDRRARDVLAWLTKLARGEKPLPMDSRPAQ